jgi:hypothetical protein
MHRGIAGFPLNAMDEGRAPLPGVSDARALPKAVEDGFSLARTKTQEVSMFELIFWRQSLTTMALCHTLQTKAASF